MNQKLTQAIALEVQLFHSIEQKENFLFLLGALLAKVISSLNQRLGKGESEAIANPERNQAQGKIRAEGNNS